ncbi:MAG: nucleotidyltransferase domain-containing protein [Candidatus Diapherotrites archaeon]
MGRTANTQVIENFARRLRKDFKDAKVFLFGSRARGDDLLESDYDVLVVSRQFEGTRFFERTEKMYDYWNEKQALEAFCYTPEELRHKSTQIGTVREAMKKGVEA